MKHYEQTVATSAYGWLTMAGRIQGEVTGLMKRLETLGTEATDAQIGMLRSLRAEAKSFAVCIGDFIENFPNEDGLRK